MAICKPLHSKAPFMHQVMVPGAQQNKILHVGFTPVGPVMDVVRFNKMAGRATREPATAITILQGAANGWWNGAGFSSRAQRLAIVCVQPLHHGRITTDAPRGFCAQRSTRFDFSFSACAILLEGFPIRVDMDQVFF